MHLYCRIPLLLVIAAATLTCGESSDSAGPVTGGIQSITPAPDASAVDLNAAIQVTYADRFTDAENIATVRLSRAGLPVYARMTRPNATTEQLTPVHALEPGQRYDVAVERVFRDQTGKSMTIEYGWSFTTLGAALPAMSRAALLDHVERLAHDSLNGRGSGTVDELRAANYIAQQFQRFGLQPGGGSFLMPFALASGASSQNVIGVLRGTGSLQNEWVVVGAHYDHVGRRPYISGAIEIFNGADDNASGTAVVLELAATLAAHIATGGLGNQPRRSIMFHAYGAEELGLIGSEHYCAQPLYPLNTVVAMLNFDMVGRLRNRNLQLGGLPTAAEWITLLTQHNRDNLALSSTDCTGCTDYACFRRGRRPVLWFFTGFHDEYHRPADDTGLINAEGLGQIADLAARAVVDLTVRQRAPAFRD